MAHQREQRLDADPLVGRTAGQCPGDRLSPGSGGCQHVDRLLPLDDLDPPELVEQCVTEPPLPQSADHLVRWLAQRRSTFGGEQQLAVLDLGQTSRLEDERPRERCDRLIGIEVTMHKLRGERLAGGCRGSSGLVATAQLARGTQVENNPQIDQSLVCGQPDSMPVSRRIVDAGHQARQSDQRRYASIHSAPVRSDGSGRSRSAIRCCH